MKGIASGSSMADCVAGSSPGTGSSATGTGLVTTLWFVILATTLLALRCPTVYRGEGDDRGMKIIIVS